MQTDPGMVLFGRGVAVPLPGNSHAVSRTIAHAYLIHVEGLANNPESVKSSSVGFWDNLLRFLHLAKTPEPEKSPSATTDDKP